MARPHRPTRQCPHRWCRPLHTATALLAGPSLVMLISKSMIIFMTVAVLSLVGYAVMRTVYGKTLTETAIEDELSKTSVTLMVRPGWARAAAAMDCLWAAAATTMAYFVFTDLDAEVARSEANPPTFASLATTSALVAAYYLTHKKATDPVKPKRVTAPAPQPT